jgi:hypothetical protein
MNESGTLHTKPSSWICGYQSLYRPAPRSIDPAPDTNTVTQPLQGAPKWEGKPQVPNKPWRSRSGRRRGGRTRRPARRRRAGPRAPRPTGASPASASVRRRENHSPGVGISPRDLRGEAVGGVMARRFGVAREVGWVVEARQRRRAGALRGGSFGRSSGVFIDKL